MQKSGEAWLSSIPSSVNGNSSLVVPNKALYGVSDIMVDSIQFKASAASVLNEVPIIYSVNLVGQLNELAMPLTPAMLNTQFNTTLVTIKANFKLGTHHAIRIGVPAGETQTVTITPKAYSLP